MKPKNNSTRTIMNAKQHSTSFDSIAKIYDKAIGNTGDITHQKTIDPALFKAIGNFKGKIIYDIGCGNGYIARKLAKNGAREVWASDISEKLINFAQEKYNNPEEKIKYLARSASDFKGIPKNYFDLIIMNMVIHYVKNKEELLLGISSVLKIGGRFVFTTSHPLRLLARVDAKGQRKVDTLEIIIKKIKSYHSGREILDYNPWTDQYDLKIHPASMSHYINLMNKNNLLVDVLVEPKTKMVMDDVRNQTPAYSPLPIIYAIGAIKLPPEFN